MYGAAQDMFRLMRIGAAARWMQKRSTHSRACGMQGVKGWTITDALRCPIGIHSSPSEGMVPRPTGNIAASGHECSITRWIKRGSRIDGIHSCLRQSHRKGNAIAQSIRV
jgi:hypothetical protein